MGTKTYMPVLMFSGAKILLIGSEDSMYVRDDNCIISRGSFLLMRRNIWKQPSLILATPEGSFIRPFPEPGQFPGLTKNHWRLRLSSLTYNESPNQSEGSWPHWITFLSPTVSKEQRDSCEGPYCTGARCTGGMAHPESAPPSESGAWEPLPCVWLAHCMHCPWHQKCVHIAFPTTCFFCLLHVIKGCVL